MENNYDEDGKSKWVRLNYGDNCLLETELYKAYGYFIEINKKPHYYLAGFLCVTDANGELQDLEPHQII